MRSARDLAAFTSAPPRPQPVNFHLHSAQHFSVVIYLYHTIDSRNPFTLDIQPSFGRNYVWTVQRCVLCGSAAVPENCWYPACPKQFRERANFDSFRSAREIQPIRRACNAPTLPPIIQLINWHSRTTVSHIKTARPLGIFRLIHFGRGLEESIASVTWLSCAFGMGEKGFLWATFDVIDAHRK